MRWVHMTIIVLFAAAMIVFAVQNRALATISFLEFSVRAPLAVVAVIFYVVGAVTGGSLLALLRKSVRASRVGG